MTIRAALERAGARTVLITVLAVTGPLVAGHPALAGPAPLSTVAAAPVREAPETISWTIDPASADGPDGRAWAELTLDPGASVTEYLAVRNLGATAARFDIKAADGYFTDTGRFTMLSGAEPSTKAGTWIAAPDSVAVPAGGTVVLPYTVTVPDNATPGDHAAGIAASVSYVGENPDGGGTLGVESRVGFRVITRVTGSMRPALTVGDPTTTYQTSWNPFAPGVLQVSTVLSNTGNVALVVAGTATAGGRQASVGLPDSAGTIELLPGDQRTVTGTVAGVWPLGPVGVTVHVAGTATDLDPVSAVASSTTWALPWPQLAALGLLALLILAAWADRRRRRARLRRLLAAERDAGRAEAHTAP